MSQTAEAKYVERVVKCGEKFESLQGEINANGVDPTLSHRAIVSTNEKFGAFCVEVVNGKKRIVQIPNSELISATTRYINNMNLEGRKVASPTCAVAEESVGEMARTI